MGAPGTSYWTGSVLVFNTSSGGMSVYLDDESGTVSFGSYLGKYMDCLVRHFLVPFSLSILLHGRLRDVSACFMKSFSNLESALTLNF